MIKHKADPEVRRFDSHSIWLNVEVSPPNLYVPIISNVEVSLKSTKQIRSKYGKRKQ